MLDKIALAAARIDRLIVNLLPSMDTNWTSWKDWKTDVSKRVISLLITTGGKLFLLLVLMFRFIKPALDLKSGSFEDSFVSVASLMSSFPFGISPKSVVLTRDCKARGSRDFFSLPPITSRHLLVLGLIFFVRLTLGDLVFASSN